MKNQKLFKFTVTALSILFVTCLVSLIMLFINGAKPDLLGQRDKDDKNEVQSPALLAETIDYGQNYVDSMVFVCDNAMLGIKTSGVLSNGEEQVFASRTGVLSLDYNLSSTHIVFPHSGAEMSIPDAIKETKPEFLLISVGIENGIHCSEEKFKEYYGKLISAIKEVSPDTRIILNSILPVSKAYEKSNSGANRDKINTVNGYIASLAEVYGVRYLNSASVMMDDKGYLKSEYDSGDGFTPNGDGYEAIVNYIRTHGYK